MRCKPGLIILITVIVTTFFIQILRVSDRLIVDESPLSLILTVLGVLTLITPLVLFRLEMGGLDRFQIDKYSLLALGASYFINLNYNKQNHFVFFVLLILFMYFIKWYYEKRGNIVNTDVIWTARAACVAVFLVSAIVIFQVLLRGSLEVIPLLKGSVFLTVLRQVLSELSFVPVEEIFYRGFLWGYLISLGWKERTAIWVQGVVFWITHIERITTPLSFFVFIPILTLILSKLRQRSNQVFPSIIAHVIINLVSAMLNLATI